MLALRRVSNSLRSEGFTVGISRACCAKLELLSSLEREAGIFESSQAVPGGFQPLKRFYHTTDFSSRFLVGRRGLSSQAGAESSGGESDLEDGFSDLEAPSSADAIKKSDADELSDDDGAIEEPSLNEPELSDTEIVTNEKRSSRKGSYSELFVAIVADLRASVNSVLDKWVADGKKLNRAEILHTMRNLRNRRMYGKALQVSEWLEKNKQLDFLEKDYASRLDLTAKVQGLQKAEYYVQKIPESFRGEVVYRTLLANCVSLGNLKKAEEVFDKMKALGFPLTAFTCNQLLLLYGRFDKTRVADILLLMEKETIKPTPTTYKILLDLKGKSRDIAGMDQIVETMKAEGIEPDVDSQIILVRHYILGGYSTKARDILKQMEGEDLKERRWVCRKLLPQYAALGSADEVGRVWKVCESDPRPEECMAAIEAWGKLKRIEEAEAVFDKMKTSSSRKPSTKLYTALLKVYADNKMVAKGRELLIQMSLDERPIGPLNWDALVKLYLETGEVEKADSMLKRAAQKTHKRPLYNSYMAIMQEYSKRGDIHNSENILHRMRQDGYVLRVQQFQTLIQAYINAKTPAYGMRERMKAENIIPSRAITMQLAQIDGFKKKAACNYLFDF